MAMLSVSSSAWAADDAPYYGPMKRWHGIGYKFGYEDKIERDGSWRIDAAIHGRGEAVDMALYRVAERAQEEGCRFVFILGSGGQMRQTTIVRDGGVQIRSSGPLVSAKPSMSFVPAPKPPLPVTAMQATVVGRTSSHERSIAEDELRDKALKDAQPVRGGNRKQGWTISD